MAKKESTYLNMTATLLIVTLVASASLGYVYELTKEPIAAAKLAKKVRAIGEVVPEYDNNPVKDQFNLPFGDAGDSLEFYPAKKGEEITGMAVKTFSPKGYSGNIYIMVGFKPDGSIHNISVLEHKETPGLGSKMSTPKFIEQFIDKDPATFNLKVEKDKGDVQALSGATISSRAFGDAVQAAYDTYMKGGKNE